MLQLVNIVSNFGNFYFQDALSKHQKEIINNKYKEKFNVYRYSILRFSLRSS